MTGHMASRTPEPDPLFSLIWKLSNKSSGKRHADQVTWDITSTCLLIVPEGVVGHIQLSPEQNEWYRLSEEAVPHVSLALRAGYQPKDLGPMTKRLINILIADSAAPLPTWKPFYIRNALKRIFIGIANYSWQYIISYLGATAFLRQLVTE